MAVGTVNQALLESKYQNAGDIYSDLNTEAAFQVVVDQVNENAGIFAAGGSDLIVSDDIAGLTSNTVYGQLTEIEAQVLAIVGGSIPPSSISTSMLQDGAVTHVKLEASEQTASVGGLMYAHKTFFGF